MKLGIISDTHITNNYTKEKLSSLLTQLREAFKDVEEIIHVGDVGEKFFLEELRQIAYTRCVKGDIDNSLNDLETFIKFSVGRYNIGVIHFLPDDVEKFARKHDLRILIFGHTHQPLIKGTDYNVLLLNPGSPTQPKAPQERPGFMKPIARPTVITLNIDENDILSTFIITLKI